MLDDMAAIVYTLHASPIAKRSTRLRYVNYKEGNKSA
jgi:hypothetical protein